jgi:hypothetical protein
VTPIASFAQPNALVYEPVEHHMTFWNDPFHFSVSMGRAIEGELAGSPEPGLPQEFMIELTPAGVNSYIAGQRAAVRRWARDHADFVAAFEAENKKAAERAAHNHTNGTVKQIGHCGRLVCRSICTTDQADRLPHNRAVMYRSGN